MRTREERERRGRAFALVRQRHTREDAQLTPEERVALTDEMLRFWGSPSTPSEASSTDEPLSFLRDVRRRRRSAR